MGDALVLTADEGRVLVLTADEGRVKLRKAAGNC